MKSVSFVAFLTTLLYVLNSHGHHWILEGFAILGIVVTVISWVENVVAKQRD